MTNRTFLQRREAFVEAPSGPISAPHPGFDVKLSYALPDSGLFDLVAVYIQVEVSGEGTVEDLLPPEMAALCFGLSGSWFYGPHRAALAPLPALSVLLGNTSHAHWIRGHQGRGFCIGLHPLAWPALLGDRAEPHIDQSLPLSALLGDGAEALAEQLAAADDFQARASIANGFLAAARRARETQKHGPAIMAMRQALADPGCSSVADLSDRVGLSQPRLARFAKAYFGFSPKMLIRRARFLRMLHRIDARTYGDWRSFIESQYVDQSHLIRDFKYFTGFSPSQYMALDRPLVAAAFRTFRELMGITGNHPDFL